MSQAKPLTTTQVARICRVHPRTVIRNWLTTGLLKGWQVPGGSLHWRIERSELAAFIVRHGMPAEWCEEVRGAA